MHLYDHVHHISIKGMSNFFPFPQSYQPGNSSREDYDLLVSYQTEQRLSVPVHHFLSQVAGLSVYVYTNLFSSSTSENFQRYISLDLSYHDHNINQQLSQDICSSVFDKIISSLQIGSDFQINETIFLILRQVHNYYYYYGNFPVGLDIVIKMYIMYFSFTSFRYQASITYTFDMYIM